MTLEQALLTWAHLTASAVWVGGSLFLGAILAPALRRTGMGTNERLTLMVLVGRRFNWAAVPALAILVATGLHMSGPLLARPDLLAASSYGTWLAIKAALVAALAGTFAVHVWIVRGSVEARIREGLLSGAELASLRRRIIVLGEAMVVMSVAILLLAALLDAGA
ncbi:MAG: CopD family protein [Thaumarchaeota archaeon]|nr:CopD family protein [Nitrososphaerota archaeon]MDD9813178.1 CopD family protein [Nitrososphaerota archaeon]